MPDIGAMKELLGRVERARCESHRLNGDIAVALGLFDPKGHERGGGDLYADRWYRRGSVSVAFEAPRFTSSIDACVALIEKVLPGHWWVVGKDNEAWVWGPDEGLEVSEPQATPPLALLAALLRALILIDERKALAEGEVRP